MVITSDQRGILQETRPDMIAPSRGHQDKAVGSRKTNGFVAFAIHFV
jgi:hypothetical protein